MSGIDTIPADVRWTAATQALTGAVTATSAVLQQALGTEAAKEASGAIWGPAGAASGRLADALGLPRPTGLAGLWDVAECLIRITMGPEFEAQVVKSTPDRLVARVTSCPWAARAQEQGVEQSDCMSGDHAWCVGLAEYYGMKVSHEITTAIPKGADFCTASYRLLG